MSGINVYTPPRGSEFDVLPLMLSLYGWDRNDQGDTLNTVRDVSLALNGYAIPVVFPKTDIISSGNKPDAVYLLSVLRAGIAMLPPGLIDLFRQASNEGKYIPEGVPILTGCIGASRPKRPDLYPADIYLNTLEGRDFSRSIVVGLEVGEATGSTIEALAKQLRDQGLDPRNFVFIAGAACLKQTLERASRHLPGAHLLAGTSWLHKEEPGEGQFYLNRILLDPNISSSKQIPVRQTPLDWGEAVARMEGELGSVDYFLNKLVAPVVELTPEQRKLLYDRYIPKESQIH